MPLRIAQAVDPAIGQSARADYFVVVTGGLDLDRTIQTALGPAHPIHLLDVYRDRITFPEQPRVIEAQYRKWQPHGATWVGIESLFYQSALIQTLIRRGTVPCRPVDRRLGQRLSPDKETRAAAAQTWYEQGRIFHPTRAPWLEDFESELLAFPRGEHDDQVDAWVDVIQLLTLGWTQLRDEPLYHSFGVDQYQRADDSGLYGELGIMEG